jgi:hypothetical protein
MLDAILKSDDKIKSWLNFENLANDTECGRIIYKTPQYYLAGGSASTHVITP